MREKSHPAVNKRDILFCILITAATVLFILNFRIVKVSGSSMEPTLADGQLLFTTTHTSHLQQNDIVIFRYEDKQCVKRVIAVGGDTVTLKNNQVYVNRIAYSNYEYDGEDQEYTIAPDEIFVLGDNTKVSLDSRMFGPVKTDQLLFKRLSFGKAV